MNELKMRKLRQVLRYIKHHKNTNDLHSFKAGISNGVVFVSYENNRWNVTAYIDIDGYEAKFDFTFDNIDECAIHLKEMYIKPETIEI